MIKNKKQNMSLRCFCQQVGWLKKVLTVEQLTAKIYVHIFVLVVHKY